DIAEITQSRAQCLDPARAGGSGPEVEVSDARDFCRLLRRRRERPRRRTAEQRDERAPSHSITSSAMASSPEGIVSLSAFAVVALITNSNFVGWRTGRSLGFSPLRMRPA